jgi:fatty-acyl-CoA synthase
MANFDQFFTCIMETFARHPAIIYGERVITYGELHERVNKLARAMLEMGVKKNDNVGLCEHNTPEFLEVTAAAWKIAARAVSINYRFKEWELKYVIDDAEMSVLFFAEDVAERFKNIRPDLETVKNYVVMGARGEHREPDMLYYEDLFKGKPATAPELPWSHFVGDDIVVIMYTGGTTGYPKGVVYRHDQVLSAPLEAMITSLAGGLSELSKAPDVIWQRAQKNLHIPGTARLLPKMLASPISRKILVGVGKGAGPFVLKSPQPVLKANFKLLSKLLGGRVRMLLASPMMHAWAYNHAIIGMIGGFTSVFLTGRGFDPVEALETIERRKINVMIAIGDGQCRPLVEELDKAAAEGRKYDLSSLMVLLSSGMALSVDVKKKLLEHMPHLIIFDTLASSEGHYMTIIPYTSSATDIQKTVFKVTETTKVINEKGEEVAVGDLGEIAILRTHQGSSEYFKDPKKSAKTYRVINGRPMIFTGDMATIDDEGRIHLIGRGSGCINTGGEKVFPEEVEDVLNKHPKVEISGITSVPHERWGSAVAAVVEMTPGESMEEAEVVSWCKEYLADYKAPKYVVFVDELPRLITGKVHYREIQKLVEEKLGIQS